MTLVELTTVEGATVWVAASSIAAIHPDVTLHDKPCTSVYMANGLRYCVKQNAASIAKTLGTIVVVGGP